jgi:hypothetical protein
MRLTFLSCPRWSRLALSSLAWGAAVLTASVPATAATPAATEAPLHVVQDPHYGDVLYEFYQSHYFASVTNLMVSQHFRRVEHHADEAEVLRGGLLLSYGLHREAGEIFAKLIETTTSASVRDRAWYFLAKIRYQRGLMAEAEAAVDRIGTADGNKLPPELEEERVLLKANLLLARGDYAGAATLLGAVKGKPGAVSYARFNLGVALVKGGEAERGNAVLDALGRAPAANEEMRNLRDKANLALGFAALQESKPEIAKTYLERVRLNGMLANKAMLGFGWADAALKQPDRALVSWVELTKRDASDPAVLEARIAVPYALTEMGAPGQALDRYQDAILLYDAEYAALSESINAIRAGKLVEGLVARNPGEDMGWFWNISRLPAMPYARHLAPVLAGHEFQEAFKSYRDLQFLLRNLGDWQEKLSVYSDMLANRRKAFAERMPLIMGLANDGGLGVQQQRAGVLSKELARLESKEDAAALADLTQQESLLRLEHAKAALASAGEGADALPPEEVAALRERVRRVSGALEWNLAREYPVRVWDVKKALKTINTELEDAKVHDAALAQAQRDEPARFERFAARIAELDQRIKALLPRVASLSQAQQQALQEIAVAQLAQQQDRLDAYAVQARFAVAQMYDQANSGRDAEHATKP